MRTQVWLAAVGMVVGTACSVTEAEPTPAPAAEQAATQPSAPAPKPTNETIADPTPTSDVPSDLPPPPEPEPEPEEPLSCASIAKRPPAGTFTMSDATEVPPDVVDVHVVVRETQGTNLEPHAYVLQVNFTTTANTCLYQRIGAHLPKTKTESLNVMRFLTAPTDDPFPVGTYEGVAGSITGSECKVNPGGFEVTGWGRGNSWTAGSITITKRTATEIEGTFAITNRMNGNAPIRTGTFRAPICPANAEPPTGCCL
ncbi:MAG: hypothetical protein KIT84_06340 [Labilithrix sp.]|nr:hypothetical protein [Labilithrix sp.]MCW5810611.1 hypothetical protein [Labilithrix sp.]